MHKIPYDNKKALEGAKVVCRDQKWRPEIWKRAHGYVYGMIHDDCTGRCELQAWALGNGKAVIPSGQLATEGWSGRDLMLEQRWPETTLTDYQLSYAAEKAGKREFANAIIAHECEVGNLVPAARLRDAELALEVAGFKRTGSGWEAPKQKAITIPVSTLPIPPDGVVRATWEPK